MIVRIMPVYKTSVSLHVYNADFEKISTNMLITMHSYHESLWEQLLL